MESRDILLGMHIEYGVQHNLIIVTVIIIIIIIIIITIIIIIIINTLFNDGLTNI